MKKFFLSAIIICATLSGFSQPKIQFKDTSHDFGTIKEEDGKVTAHFEFTNEGTELLELTNVKASCGCTTPNWTKGAIAPGASGFVDATYNPSGRPGSFSKTITITTNEAENNTIHLFIKGNVIKRPPTEFEKSGYTVGNGMTRIKNDIVKFTVLNTEIHKDTLLLKNFWTKPVTIAFKNLPDYIKEYHRNFGKELAPNQEGAIVLEYNAAKKNALGTLDDVISIETNDSLSPIKNINIKAVIKEDFSKLNKKDLEKAPVCELNGVDIDFGVVSKDNTTTQNVTVTNKGKTPLIIRDVQVINNNTITPSIKTASINKDESVTITFTYKAQGRFGKQKGTIDIITNDPNNSVITINFNVEIKQ